MGFKPFSCGRREKADASVEELGQPVPLSGLGAFMPAAMIVGVVLVMIMVTVAAAPVSVRVRASGLPLHLPGRPGSEAFTLSAIEPDSPAFLADIDGNSIPFPFIECMLVASRAQHVSPFIQECPGADDRHPEREGRNRMSGPFLLGSRISWKAYFHNNEIMN